MARCSSPRRSWRPQLRARRDTRIAERPQRHDRRRAEPADEPRSGHGLPRACRTASAATRADCFAAARSRLRTCFLVRGLAAATVNGPEVLDKVFLSIDDASLPTWSARRRHQRAAMYAGHAAGGRGSCKPSSTPAAGKSCRRRRSRLPRGPRSLWTELEGRGQRRQRSWPASAQSSRAGD